MTLISRAKAHDRQAFAELMQSCGSDMYKVAKAMLGRDEDAADAMQDTALTCWEKIDTLRQDAYFKTWMTRILINHCNAILRERKRMTAMPDALPGTAYDGDYSSLEWKLLLEGLDEKYRIVVILYYVEGFKSREIAQLLDINDSTVRSRLSEARSRILSMYAQKDETAMKQARIAQTVHRRKGELYGSL